MERTDYIQTHEDIISNIETLYSYLHGESDEENRQWAVDKLKRGKNMVVEVIGDHICFAPSRFVGYINNTREKHDDNHGDGTDTDNVLKKYYNKIQDGRLDFILQKELAKHGESSTDKKYWILKETTIEDILKVEQVHEPILPLRTEYDKFWHIQMHLPEGKGGIEINSISMLRESEPIIGTGEWDDAQCRNFKTIEKGNIVLVRKGSQALALCQIIGDNFVSDFLCEKYVNVNFRKVKILGWASEFRQPRTGLFSQGTFSSCSKGTEQYGFIESWLKYMNDIAYLEKCSNLLLKKRNIILQGAPGTGKTYNTAAIALSVLGVTDVDLTDHEAVMEKYEELRKKDQIAFCTFHQSMEYEDFVEGLKPFPVKNAEGNVVGMEYKVDDGIFKQICEAAMENLMQSLVAETPQENYSELFDKYCSHIEKELAELAVAGKDAAIALHPKSKMKMRGISRNHSGKISSIIIAKDDNAATQSLSKKIFLRDYEDFRNGKIKSYTDIKPAYESQSDFHGNAIYYFPLYGKIEEYSKTDEGKIGQTKKVEKKNYVLIIDEINRGNVAKIFGELITLLESDKRVGDNATHPIKVKLPYSKNFDDDGNEDFAVPSNLYIIGTMNTTDRSTGTLDYALRRRFAFVTLKANVEVIEQHYDKIGDAGLKETAVNLFNDIKKFIESPAHLSGDMSIDDLMVGHSYFMAESKEELAAKIEYEVLPLIAEYINDGILNVKSEEKKKAFDAWLSLSVVAEPKEENID